MHHLKLMFLASHKTICMCSIRLQLLTLVPFPMKTESSARLYTDPIIIATAKLENGLELSVEEILGALWFEVRLTTCSTTRLFVSAWRKAKKTALLTVLLKNLLNSAPCDTTDESEKIDESPESCYGIRSDEFSLASLFKPSPSVPTKSLPVGPKPCNSWSRGTS